MWHTTAGRDKDEVKEWVLERIQNKLDGLDILEDAGVYRHLEMIQGHIEHDIMLHKEEAKTLESILESELRYEVEQMAHREPSSIILKVDELSIYPDAWGLYCRPGTYQI
jgi:hypothetical protein